MSKHRLDPRAGARLRPAGIAVAAATLLAMAFVADGMSSFAAAATPSPAISLSPSPSVAAAVPPSVRAMCGNVNISVPATIASLPLAKESVCSSLSPTTHEAAVDAINLYSLRTPDKVLVATLEVSHVKAGQDPNAMDFRLSVVDAVGDTSPLKLRVGGQDVWVSLAKGLTLMTWFRGRDVFILAVRDVVNRPRSMLRDALEIRP